ncbi:MAG: 6-pyruvoyl-tetrahydropterin synthase-related protein [Anaerolineae bacterium]|jgi:hypothetical protein|nr:6-pyruvoyl-tetrahydropterin synthase-related protein [Anaerolineae bacterium]
MPLSRAAAVIGVLVALCVVLIVPLLGGTMLETADGTLHLHRIITLRHALSEGDLWARYVPGTVYGYGSPMFNYYSPLSIYPMLGLHLLGMTPVHAWLVGMAIYVVLAAGGAYVLARRWLPTAGALTAATAYAAAPYTLYDVLWRGTTSEIASLAVLPWVMAAMHALAVRPSRGRFAAVALWVAVFMPMHNVITLHAAALLAAFGVVLALQAADKPRTLIRLAIAGMIGAALCAFFWLPAIRETGLVKIDGVTANLPEIDVTRNLAPLTNAFALPATIDPAQQQPPVAVALGWPALILGAVGVIALWRRGQPGLAAFCVGGITVLLFMNTPASAVVWRTIPLIQYSQFPTRLIGPATLLLAILAGSGGAALASVQRPVIRNTLYAVSLGALLVYSVPYLYRIQLPEIDPRTISDTQNFERTSGYVDTSSFGEYVPRWSEAMPDPDALTERYAQSAIIPRFAPPDGVTVSQARWGLTSADLTVETAETTPLVFDWFYLPHWQITLDGQPAEPQPNPVDGRLSVTVPPGRHALSLALMPSQTQQTATLISYGALAGLVMLVVGWRFTRPVFGRDSQPSAQPVVPSPAFQSIIIAAAVGLSVLGLKILVFDNLNTPLRTDRFSGGYAGALTAVTEANINNQLTLIGYDAPTINAPAGDELSYNLYWSARERMAEDYQIIARLETRDGQRVSQVDDLAPAGTGTRNWLPGYYLIDPVTLPIPPDTPPGDYRVVVEVFRLSDRQSLPVINAVGNPEGVALPLATVNISAGQPPTARPIIVAQGDALGLVLVGGIGETLSVGQEVDLRLTWLATRDLTDADTVSLAWVSDGQTLAETNLSDSLSYAGWPGERVYTARHRLYVPGDLTAGEFTPVLRWEGGEYALPMIEITTPERTFTAPDDLAGLDGVVWDNGLRLLGITTDADDIISLIWQTDQPLTTPLRRFAHQVDADGQIISVVDGVPVEWTRPVTGWAVGEVILDPVGALGDGLTLRVGWYDPISGRRVTLDSGADSFDLLEALPR